MFRVHAFGQSKENAALNELSSRNTQHHPLVRLSFIHCPSAHWSLSRAVHWSLKDTSSFSSWKYTFRTEKHHQYIVWSPGQEINFFLSQRRYAWWEFLPLFSVSRSVTVFISFSPVLSDGYLVVRALQPRLLNVLACLSLGLCH